LIRKMWRIAEAVSILGPCMTDPLTPPTLLVLGGTAEARDLASALAADGRFTLHRARDLGSAGDISPRAIIDARHPFSDGDITGDVPVLRLMRPAWQPRDGDQWTEVPDGIEAAALIPERATVLVATGRGRLAELSGLAGRTVWWRRRGPVDSVFPFAAGGWLTEEGPFTEAEELALFERLGIDWLIVQNAGGQGAYPKLAAARRLGISVAMIARPQRSAPSVRTVGEALAWLDTLSVRA
jgi:precorrin-6A/cobalt-precorrin-6A reductase